jgi:hypothetical protein
MISRIGWFDERLPGVGNEDEDYEARLALQGIGLPSFELSALRNVVVKTKDFSYGKEMAVINEKYTSDNKRFFNSKWEITNEAQDDFVHVRILQKAVRLRPGMETPNFYPEIHYPQVKS